MMSILCKRALRSASESLTSVRTIASSSSLLTSKKDATTTVGDIKNVVVVGGGFMGAGVAQVAAQNDFNVTVVDEEDEYIQKCMVTITKSLSMITKRKFEKEPKAASKFIDDVFSRLKTTRYVEQAVEDADIVIECIHEDLSAKRQLFQVLDDVSPSKTLFASNTSSLSICDLANVTKRPDRVGGLHFFNPVPLMSLVEVIRAADTSDATHKTLLNFAKDLGKNPVICNDTPGFIVNKLLIPYIMQAIRFAEGGNASTRDIDTAMKLGASYPMGPFELADYIGLDKLKFIINNWHGIEPDNPLYHASPALDKLVSQSKLGRKSGEGFYRY